MNNKEINRVLRENTVTLFCGAGISFDSPTNSPSWLDLRNILVRETFDLHPIFRQFQVDFSSLPFTPEVIVSSFAKFIEPIPDILGICFQHLKPNKNHFIIAELVRRGFVKEIFTTNWDFCIEKALSLAKINFISLAEHEIPDSAQFKNFISSNTAIVYKLHGCCSIPSTIVATTEEISKQTKRKWREKLQRSLATSNIIFWGYRGSELAIGDYLGLSSPPPNVLLSLGELFQKRKYIFWDAYDQNSLHPKVHEFHTQFLNRKSFRYLFRRKFVITSRAFPRVFINLIGVSEEHLNSQYHIDPNEQTDTFDQLLRNEFQKLGVQLNLVELSLGICLLLEHIGEVDTILEITNYVKGIEPDSSLKVELLMYRSRMLQSIGDHNTALRELDYAEKILSCERDLRIRKSFQAIIFNNRGLSKYSLKLYDEALEDFDKCVNIFKDTSPQELSTVYCNIGLVYLKKGHKGRAIRIFEKDYDHCLKSGRLWGALQTLKLIKDNFNDPEVQISVKNRITKIEKLLVQAENQSK